MREAGTSTRRSESRNLGISLTSATSARTFSSANQASLPTALPPLLRLLISSTAPQSSLTCPNILPWPFLGVPLPIPTLDSPSLAPGAPARLGARPSSSDLIDSRRSRVSASSGRNDVDWRIGMNCGVRDARWISRCSKWVREVWSAASRIEEEREVCRVSWLKAREISCAVKKKSESIQACP